MKQLEISWTVKATVFVPDDCDLDDLRRQLANQHRPSSCNPYGSGSQIRKESFSINVVDVKESIVRTLEHWGGFGTGSRG